MISRIRIEARAATMEEAEREIGMLLDHARMAGYLEGVVPSISFEPENAQHYGRVNKHDGWSDLGMTYEGRAAVAFEPERIVGGLKLYGYTVQINERDQQALLEHPPSPSRHGEDATDKVMVLERHVPVTREHSWEGSSLYGYDPDGRPDERRDTPREVGSDEHLATFNRPRHEEVGGLLVEVWLQGLTDGEDRPTRVLGHVSPSGISNSTYLFKYVHEIKVGESIDEVVEEVFEKAKLWAAGRESLTPDPIRA